MSKSRRPVTPKRARVIGSGAEIPAPIPGIVGFVDAGSIRRLGDFIEVVLYERYRGPSAVAVARLMITPSDFVARFWEAASVYYETLTALNAYNLAGPLVVEEPLTLEFPHAVVCNFFQWSRVGMEAMLDCSYVTARSVLRARQGEGDLEVVPIAAFQMPTRLQQHLLSAAKSLAEVLRSEMMAAPPGVL